MDLRAFGISGDCEDDEVDEEEPDMCEDGADDKDEWKNWEGVEEEYAGWFQHQCFNFHVHTHRKCLPLT